MHRVTEHHRFIGGKLVQQVFILRYCPGSCLDGGP